MTDKLLPCPFCGGEAALFSNKGAYWVQCINKAGNGVMGGCLNGTAVYKRHPEIPALDYDPKEKAIAAWNTRAERTCHDTNDEEHDFTCSECGASMYTQIDDCWTMIAKRGWRDDVIEHPNYCPNCGAKVVS